MARASGDTVTSRVDADHHRRALAPASHLPAIASPLRFRTTTAPTSELPTPYLQLPRPLLFRYDRCVERAEESVGAAEGFPPIARTRSPSLPEALPIRDISLFLSFNLFEQDPIYSQSSAVSARRQDAGHEVYEVHDPFTQRPFTPQRQQSLQYPQHHPPRATLRTRPSTSSGGSTRTLRRTPRFGDDTDLLRRDRRTTPTPLPELRPQPATGLEPEPRLRTRPRRRLTQDLGSESQDVENSTTTGADTPAPDESYWPRRSTRVSRRTAQAILFALEEAIRAPYPFTPDRTEEEARLSQLLMAGIPEYDDPLPGGAPPPPREPGEGRAITPPTKIMEMRREREAKRREEKLQEERRRTEISQQQRRQKEERQGEAGVADATRPPLGPVSQGDGRTNPGQTAGRATDMSGIDPSVLNQSVNRRRTASQPAQPAHQPGGTQANQTAGGTRGHETGGQTAGRTNRQSQTNPTAQTSEQTRTRSKTTSSFPHAFERWETLSSHWEGLTGYWIKKLDANKDELSRQPLNQQLSRQVTDLSSAGANLFHAVVELQRLRASSERKFQRWFFETRKEQEQANEKIASLEKDLKSARQNQREVGQSREVSDQPTQEQLRSAQQAAQQAAQGEIERVKAQMSKQLAEMKRELQISRDEARRGWEEIGRMEQSERDRMFSLKRGEPTLVGGVQVVPMAPKPAGSTRPTTREGGLSSHPVQPEDVQYANFDQAQYGYEHARSETDTDPFTESTAPRGTGMAPSSQPSTTYPTSSAAMAAMAASTRAKSASPNIRPSTSAGTSPRPGAQTRGGHAEGGEFPPRSESYAAPRAPGPTSAPAPSGGGAFYQQPASVLHQAPGASLPTVLQAEDARSFGTASEDEYMLDSAGNPVRDAQGRPVAYRSRHGARSPSEASEDYGQPIAAGTGYAGFQAAQQSQRMAAVTSNGNGHFVPAPDYEGAGYGNISEWGAVPRHHHPTRLSDVLEEDERSRTSPSRASSRSRGFR